VHSANDMSLHGREVDGSRRAPAARWVRVPVCQAATRRVMILYSRDAWIRSQALLTRNFTMSDRDTRRKRADLRDVGSMNSLIGAASPRETRCGVARARALLVYTLQYRTDVNPMAQRLSPLVIPFALALSHCGGQLDSSAQAGSKDAGTAIESGTDVASGTGGSMGEAGDTGAAGAAGLADPEDAATESTTSEDGGTSWTPDPSISGSSSCAGRCGEQAGTGCGCDQACQSEGSCCVDYGTWCEVRDATHCGSYPPDACQVDDDCQVDGCAGYICHNPGLSLGYGNCNSFCEGTCGCVEGQCVWYTGSDAGG